MAEKRSPYHVFAAAALPAETVKYAKSTHLNLDDDSFADSGTTGPVIAPFPSDPLSKADPWLTQVCFFNYSMSGKHFMISW